jgi:hypothetical protein
MGKMSHRRPSISISARSRRSRRRLLDEIKDYSEDEEVEVKLNPDDVRFVVRSKDDDIDIDMSVPSLQSPDELAKQSDEMLKSIRKAVHDEPMAMANELEKDLAELRSKGLLQIGDVAKGNESENGILDAAKGFLSTALVVDFFVIIGLLVWFVAATIQKQMTPDTPWLLERFQDIFMPVVQPTLGFLMIGSVVSGIGGDKKDEK